MNSPSLETDNVLSPITEAENLQNDDCKQWNKSFCNKKTMTMSQGLVSPRLEPVAALVSPSHPQKQYVRQNGIPYRKKLRLEDEEYDSLEMACNLASELPDDCDTFGKHVASQLRLMTKMQKFMAERLISEICFRGQIQHLQLSTNIVNSSQPPQQQQQQPPQQPQQNHIQAPIFPRPPHISAAVFARSPEFLMLHQQGIRPPNFVSPFQTFMGPQSENGSNPLEHVGIKLDQTFNNV